MPVNKIIGGSFMDSAGNPLSNGRLEFELKGLQGIGVTPSAVEGTVIAICGDTVVELPLDENGDVNPESQFLWPNDVILQASLGSIASGFPQGPTPSYYLLSAYSASGELAWGPNAVYIPSSPNPFNLGDLIPSNP